MMEIDIQKSSRFLKNYGFAFLSLLCICSCTVSASTPDNQTTLSLSQTSSRVFPIDSFAAYHRFTPGDDNQALLFGAIPVQPPAADLPDDLAVFSGRWEGYSYAPPVKKDVNMVLVVSEINADGATALAWSGTNLQYNGRGVEYHFRVRRDDGVELECLSARSGEPQSVVSFRYDAARDQLVGWVRYPYTQSEAGPFLLTRAENFYVYRDYPRYLAGLGITAHEYENPQLAQYGKGYLLYLPPAYEEHPEKTWPLIYFLHGSGDRGDNLYVLAKASPFMYIREHGPLEAIIAAPLFKNSSDRTFPVAYTGGALDEILSRYRVDKDRVTLTGLSLGGEAVWRLALARPGDFAAAAPLCGFLEADALASISAIKDLPVWAIHGAEDQVVKPEWGQAPVDALRAAGGDVKWSLLPGHDHDVWSDTYSDPAFYDWLLAQRQP